MSTCLYSVTNGGNIYLALEADSDCGVEEMILVADAGRLDAMAEILNIKNEEGISVCTFFFHFII